MTPGPDFKEQFLVHLLRLLANATHRGLVNEALTILEIYRRADAINGLNWPQNTERLVRRVKVAKNGKL